MISHKTTYVLIKMSARGYTENKVTMMPTVAHYICPKKDCNGLVTHEIVHISPDLKHDAHVAKQFTTLAIDVIRKNGIKIHKIVQFTDQAPSQYKNKTAFR